MLWPRSLSFLVLVLSLGLLPQTAPAQMDSFNFCTVFQQIPQTEGVRSALFEEWDTDTDAWASTEHYYFRFASNEETPSMRHADRYPVSGIDRSIRRAMAVTSARSAWAHFV